MLKQLQDLVDVFKSDEDLKRLEIEIDETCASIEVVDGLHRCYETFELSCDSSNERSLRSITRSTLTSKEMY